MADDKDLSDEFGGQPETDAGAAGAAGYVANFEGDEIDGKRYKLGEKIADGIDPGTIAYLVQNGRITAAASVDTMEPSGGDSNTLAGSPGSPPTDIANALSADEKARVDELVEQNSGDALAELAEEAGVSKSGTKAEVAERIVRAERSE